MEVHRSEERRAWPHAMARGRVGRSAGVALPAERDSHAEGPFAA
jgi:hypothetical protein